MHKLHRICNSLHRGFSLITQKRLFFTQEIRYANNRKSVLKSFIADPAAHPSPTGSNERPAAASLEVLLRPIMMPDESSASERDRPRLLPVVGNPRRARPERSRPHLYSGARCLGRTCRVADSCDSCRRRARSESIGSLGLVISASVPLRLIW